MGEQHSLSVLANLRRLRRIHAATVDLEPGQAGLDLEKIRRRKLDIDRAHVFSHR